MGIFGVTNMCFCCESIQMIMKFFLPLLLLLCGMFSTAQDVQLNAKLFPKPGDTLLLATDNLPQRIDPGEAGQDLNWNFINLKAPYARAVVVKSGKQVSPYFEADVLVLQLDNEEWQYLRKTDEGLELIGEQNVTPIFSDILAEGRYQPPILEQPSSLKYGDTWSSESTFYMPFSTKGLALDLLKRQPIRPDSLRFRIDVNRTNEVDASGQLTLPGGIFDVLRVKRVEVLDIALDAKVGEGNWQDVTHLSSDLQGARKRRLTTYRFLSDQASEPIAVVHTAPDGSPEKVVFKANRKTQRVRSSTPTRGTVYAFPTEAFLDARFEFTDLPKGIYTLRLYNLLGVEVFRERYFVDGTRTEKIDVTGFQSGAYLYSLADENGRIIATKRFYVKRP